MECQSTDSKQVFQVFDASKRKKSKKRQGRLDDSNSAVTDGSNYSGGVSRDAKGRASSAKASIQDMANSDAMEIALEKKSSKRIDSSPDRPMGDNRRHSSRSPRRSRRPGREGVSLALKAGLVSTPRSQSPRPDGDAIDNIPQDQDSFIYAFLEDAIKRDKKKQRHSKRHEQKSSDRDRDRTRDRDLDRDRERQRDLSKEERRHRRKHRDEVPAQERKHHKDESSYRHRKEEPANPLMDQAALLETFAKFCTQMSENKNPQVQEKVTRSQSHKSLQCEVEARNDSYDIDQRPVRLNKHSRENVALPASRNRSPQSFKGRVRSHENIPVSHDKCACCYEKPMEKYASKLDVRSRVREIEGERYREYPPIETRSRIDTRESRRYLDYNYREDERRDMREKHYDDRKRPHDYLKPLEKASRSFDVNREVYDDDRYCRRTSRSDKDKRLEEFRDKRYEDRERKYMDRDHREKYLEDSSRYAAKEKRRPRRLYERFDRNSIGSRDDVDRLSERERDSGLSVADETSTLSGRSNYLRVVKQEIAEQRESMDKMMKLWKELMKCFKGISQPQDLSDKKTNAESVRDSAAAQLRLWRECMRRYETVARDVGDTDARLMEEINKQRSEMAEMASMWQECLQRYREMSNDFISLKQQLATSESPTRQPAPPPACAEGEGAAPPVSPQYRMPPNYPPPVTVSSGPTGPLPGPYGGHPPLRGRASAPWEWWCSRPDQEPRRRQSSPESRGSHDRDQRRKHRERDDSRYKAKTTKPTAARSDHRHRKR